MEVSLPGNWQPAPVMTEADLSGSFWSFGLVSEPPFAPFVVLAPEGLIGNYQHPNEDLWQVSHGQLIFTSAQGLTSTVFDAAQIQDGEVIALAGRALLPGPARSHELRRVAHPRMAPHASPDEPIHKPEFLSALDRPRRPNLVIVRASDNSVQPHWTRDISDCDRNWDLCLSYYGDDPTPLIGTCEFLTHQPLQRKFPAIHDLFYPGSPLLDYDRVWYSDDDVMTTWADVNQLFHLSRRYGLDLAQPALQQRPDCYIAHWFTAQQPQTVLRYIGFVEIMCPLFSARALRICLGSLRDVHYGFGLDHLWPALLGGPRARIAVIDAVGVIHTRPMGQNYNVAEASAEEQAILEAYRWSHYHLPMVPVPAG